MWPCHRGVRKKAIVWGHVFILSVVIHGVLLFGLFFLYSGYYGEFASYVVMLNRKVDTPVVFLPLYKRVGTQLTPATTRTKKSSKQQASAVKKADTTSKKTAKSQPQSHKAMTSLESSAPKQKKEIQKTPIKKNEAKKTDRAKQEKKQEKKEAMPQPEQKKEEQKIENTVTEEKQIIPQEEAIPIEDKPDAASQETALYIGQAERDALIMYEQIQEALEHYWRPPAGLSHDLQCQMRVVVGWDGRAHEITVEKKSGVPVYDISARSALTAMRFPTSAYGKEVIIHFTT
jgi:hypothetical protein